MINMNYEEKEQLNNEIRELIEPKKSIKEWIPQKVMWRIGSTQTQYLSPKMCWRLDNDLILYDVTDNPSSADPLWGAQRYQTIESSDKDIILGFRDYVNHPQLSIETIVDLNPLEELAITKEPSSGVWFVYCRDFGSGSEDLGVALAQMLKMLLEDQNVKDG